VDIVLINTRGELVKFFSAADLAIVGEDRNLFEPASQWVPILYFPGVWRNNQTAKHLLDDAGGAVQIQLPILYDQVASILAHPEDLIQGTENAMEAFRSEVVPAAQLYGAILLGAAVLRSAGATQQKPLPESEEDRQRRNRLTNCSACVWDPRKTAQVVPDLLAELEAAAAQFETIAPALESLAGRLELREPTEYTPREREQALTNLEPSLYGAASRAPPDSFHQQLLVAFLDFLKTLAPQVPLRPEALLQAYQSYGSSSTAQDAAHSPLMPEASQLPLVALGMPLGEKEDDAGRCVTGDTLLPILKKAESRRQKAEDEWVVETVAIKDVQAGMRVYSLNEATGRLEPRRIKGLLAMGVKPVYRLTTASGRSITTTANHPYLVRVQGRG